MLQTNSLSIPRGFHTSVKTLHDGLQISTTTDPSSSILDQFFKEYDHAFILPEEKETLKGFQISMAFNANETGRSLIDLYGPFTECIMILTSGQNPECLAGANFTIFLKPDLITVNLSYLFVSRWARGHGYMRLMIEQIRSTIRAIYKAHSDLSIFIFVELNDPHKMSSQAYRRDSQHTGLDQIERMKIWQHLGARVINFDYSQPALDDRTDPADYLLYATLSDGFKTLPASLLHDHLLSFFAISILKGKSPYQDPLCLKQLSKLEHLARTSSPVSLSDLV